MATQKITDKFGRIHDYLRISLTERCNLRCFYCMPEEGVKLRDKANFMTSEEVIDIAKAFVELGVKKIRITGGEPLIKKDVAHILTELGKLPIELSLTTNAVLVDKFIDVFKKAGITGINVSLDSLNEDSFNQISKRNYFKRIKENIDLLLQHQFKVKINVVVMRGVNEHEIPDFIKWTQQQNVQIRFIEFMPFDGNQWEWDKKVSFKEMMQIAENAFGISEIIKIKDKPNDTAKSFKLKNGKGNFGIISTVTNPFCDTCNRIRLTADGKIKNCLFSKSETDLLTNYRKKRDLKPIIFDAIMSKEKSRGGAEAFDDDFLKSMKNRSMTAIGG
jgi:cyclic pyranopterin phosphate synthase